jgi:hypothetical protein
MIKRLLAWLHDLLRGLDIPDDEQTRLHRRPRDKK